MPSLNQERIAGVFQDRGPAIVRCAEQGLPVATICERFGLHHAQVRAFLSKERQKRSVKGNSQLPETRKFSGRASTVSDGAAVLLRDATLHALDSLHLEAGTPAPERSSLPRRWQVEPDGKPAVGGPSLPGYAAWELVHGAGMGVREVAKRLGLRYPSEVYELLEQHKRGLQAMDHQQAVENKNRIGLAF